MPASVIWLVLTLATAAYARNKACLVVLGITIGVVTLQSIGQLNAVSWALIDFVALVGASYLWFKEQDHAAFTVGAFITLRLLWHAQFNGLDLYTYYLGANLIYGMMLIGIVSWTFYYSR